ncbi:MAG TPA: alpha/beta hydrolase [bacterium]
MKTQLVFIPGLGADARLFHLQQKSFKKSIAPPWIIPQKDETLTQYARRWSKNLQLKRGSVLVGVSFGGMVALEMAKWVKPKAVLLVSSCRSPASVPLILRVAGSFPVWPHIGKILVKLLPFGRKWFLGARTKIEQNLLARMFLETPDSFLLWTVSAIRGWGGFKGGFANIHHIHGDNDHLIPIQNVRPDKVIKGGGHVINLTHSKEINDFINEYLSRGGSGQ